MINKTTLNRRRLLSALYIGSAGATFKWSTPVVNSILLPAHAVTSVDEFPGQLAGIWIARYTTRPVIFRLTINSDGGAEIFQEIVSVFGIPIFRIDTLSLESFFTADRQIRWSSARTRIEARYDSAFGRLEGVEQIGNQTPSSFVANRV